VLFTGDMNAKQDFFCRATRSGMLHSASGGSSGRKCRYPSANGIDWVLGTRDVRFSAWQADKTTRQLRAYDAAGNLLVAYPATIGSTGTPSPTGTHLVNAVAPMPNYTYNPDVNFQQGDNTEKLIIPPGPNGPVGSMWIDLTEPTFGIHGTPDPSKIDKTQSHGCVRLTNWDAEELSKMVKPGVPVVFIG